MNCTFTFNKATTGGGTYSSGMRLGPLQTVSFGTISRRIIQGTLPKLLHFAFDWRYRKPFHRTPCFSAMESTSPPTHPVARLGLP